MEWPIYIESGITFTQTPSSSYLLGHTGTTFLYASNPRKEDSKKGKLVCIAKRRRKVEQRREGGDAGRQSLSAATILEDEKRGIFRVIDISPAKREERKRFKKFGEDDPVPPPRAASMKPTQR